MDQGGEILQGLVIKQDWLYIWQELLYFSCLTAWFLISSFKNPYTGNFGKIPLINHIFAVGETMLIEKRIWTMRHNAKPQIENMNKTLLQH